MMPNVRVLGFANDLQGCPTLAHSPDAGKRLGYQENNWSCALPLHFSV